jgi:hypothetical protein
MCADAPLSLGFYILVSIRHWRKGRRLPLADRIYLSGATIVLLDPSGAACMPGGLWPWGLSAGAPPDCVLIGPVQPCGCNWPFCSGGVF